MKRLYPVMLDIEGMRCTVVGGGPVAERKVRGLLEAGADVLIIAPALTDGLRELAEQGFTRTEEREYREEDLERAVLAFAATSDRQVNERVLNDARRLGIPVNAADDAAGGSFVAPSVVRRGGLVLAVSASGSSPALAAQVAAELAERYDDTYTAYTEWLGGLRELVKAAVTDAAVRRRLLRAALEVPENEWRNDTDAERLAARVDNLLRKLDGGYRV
ncbi:precorrin-2 dehydrogenase [Paenibacillus darwinianus]|uniref:precorrin-2 dehydrogenase n=1 Tax=Paenibacillus darwinianus TaxID=1380763 RepID=A0A9W5W7Y4_9BACL|nr:bifunctional precorrin-2 dehydrogenase/sirohydrochlorin ferrochelatase [Paenibacillus darwinianus]EXX89365.1 precorrin-2 dehydrogenase [Paenibacillus darwinianus]EXX90158.1 precorrin-2 dehydrogenase [Paenibacillus darwinianus]EXX91474.1 precorrin-2 dehydrogenase [Paenibacillus darwinianus]